MLSCDDDLFSLAASKAARDAGIALVTENSGEMRLLRESVTPISKGKYPIARPETNVEQLKRVRR